MKSDIIIYGDLFLRRFMRLFFVVRCCVDVLRKSLCCDNKRIAGIVVASLFVVTTSQGQEKSTSILDKVIDIEHYYEGESGVLISKIEQLSGVSVSYSNRVYSAGDMKLRFRKGTVRQFLDEIFCRFPVEYIEQGSKIIVAPSKIEYYTICGFCRDALTGESLIGASVYDTLLYVGHSSNEYGFFSVKMPAGKVPLCVSYVGYNPLFREVTLESDTMIEVRLRPTLMIEDVEIIAPENMVTGEELGVVELPITQVKNMPSLLGESDVMKAFQLTPGVQSGEEGFGGMSVRGGGADQNILLLDDVPLYSSSHLMGLYSIFNIESVNKAKLVKGGFPARYGGRLSSVVDIKTKEGNIERYGGHVNVGLLSSNATLEGPIIKDKMSFIVSGRRTYFDLFSAKMQSQRDNKYSFYFYDVTAKLNYIVSPSDRIYVSFLSGYDHFDYGYNYRNVTLEYEGGEKRSVAVNDNQKIKWGSLVSSVRWNHIFGNSLFMNFTSFLSRYRFRNTLIATEMADTYGYRHKYFSGVHDWGGRVDFTWYLTALQSTMRFGANITHHTFTPSVTIMTASAEDSTATMLNTKSQKTMKCYEYHLYWEDEFEYGKLRGNIGLHISALNKSDMSQYMRIEPRMSLGYDFTRWLAVKVGYTDMTQFLQLMRIASVASPADIWLPISSTLSPPRSWQWNFEGRVKLTNYLTFTTELYYKKFVHTQTYKNTNLFSILSSDEWDSMFVNGEGYAKGLEFFLLRDGRRLNGWLGYSWSRSLNRFDEINNGVYFPSDNDRTHSLFVNCSYKVTESMDFSAAWSYNTGSPVTISDQRYVIAGNEINSDMPMLSIEGKRNGYRMPNSHTLSLGVNIRKKREKTSRILSFGVYNVYSRKNPMFVYWKQGTEPAERDNYELKQFSLIAWPWPYLRYSIQF